MVASCFSHGCAFVCPSAFVSFFCDCAMWCLFRLFLGCVRSVIIDEVEKRIKGNRHWILYFVNLYIAQCFMCSDCWYEWWWCCCCRCVYTKHIRIVIGLCFNASAFQHSMCATLWPRNPHAAAAAAASTERKAAKKLNTTRA